LILNLSAQFYAIFLLYQLQSQNTPQEQEGDSSGFMLDLSTVNTMSTRMRSLTHLVIKTNAGLGVLYLMRIWGGLRVSPVTFIPGWI